MSVVSWVAELDGVEVADVGVDVVLQAVMKVLLVGT
jgi:hypothetical protein